jgi:imidazolonepropionase
MAATTVVRGIDVLLTMDPNRGAGQWGRIDDGAVAMVGDRITWVGRSADAPPASVVVDGAGCVGLPGLVDCHTHAVWAGSRAVEFQRRLAGANYTDILMAGGGILSTVRATREASLEHLTELAAHRLGAMRDKGVTAVEIKSGYGLSPEAEERCLKAAKAAGTRAGVHVSTTFWGAHTVPEEFRGNRAGYVREVIEVQLPRLADIADAIDVYVDDGAFTVEEGRAILSAGRQRGLHVRIHAEQVAYTGAAEMAADLGARSADHLEQIDAAGIAAMARSGTLAVLLPGAMLYLRDPPPPVGAMRVAGIRMAVATDLNPGTSPVADLWACATLACVTMRLTVEEALCGITSAAADVLGLADRGRLRPGGAADFVLARPAIGEPPEPAVLLQHLGAPRLEALFVGGVRV